MFHSSSKRRFGKSKSRNSGEKMLHPLSRVPFHHSLDEMVLDFLETLDTPRSLTVWLMYKYNEHRSIVELSINPLMYDNPELFRRDYAATKVLSKSSGLNTGINTDEVAILAAKQGELQCLQTNVRLRSHRQSACADSHEDVIFHHARVKIAKILGELPSVDSFIQQQVGWSKGRTTSSFGPCISSTLKYKAQPDVTIRARGIALRFLRDSPLWSASVIDADAPCSALSNALHITQGNVMRIVPKNAKTGRVICFEPHMNIRIQLSVGSYLRKRLKRSGVNLDDQSVNQRRARLASKTGHLSTIDLRSASDTLSSELVWELLPYEWASFLDDIRSEYTSWPDGSITRNEKFSSMGNGFTFELESLIFYALACAVDDKVSVYGDDIICSTSNYHSVISALTLGGFLINESKSFSSGWFRESCGVDMFRGFDVTPPYLRNIKNIIENCVKFHNQVFLWLGRDICPHPRWKKVLMKWKAMLQVPLGPQGYGDGHLFSTLDEARPSRAAHGIEGWWFQTYVKKLHRSDVDDLVSRDLGYAALCAVTGPRRLQDWNSLYSNLFIDRRRWKYVRTRVLCHEWQGISW